MSKTESGFENFDSKEIPQDDPRKSKNSKTWFVVKNLLRITFKTLFFGTLVFLIALVFGGYIYYIKIKSDFLIDKPNTQVTQSIFYDKNGDTIYESYGTKEPVNVSLSDLPESVVQTTLAAEDVDFYNHGAYDLNGISRAVYENYKNSGGNVSVLFDEDSYNQGGSTITQQLVKNRYLSNEKSFIRKIKELVYAAEMEKKYSKDQILEMYLNETYFGEQALGIQNAALVYFEKDVGDLSLAEASMLAGLPQAPTRYSPVSGDFHESKKRQEYVLQQMVAAGYIDLDTAKKTANEVLYTSGKKDFVKKYPFFVDWLIKELDSKFGSGYVENGGLKVYTTLDTKIQNITEAAVTANVEKLERKKVTNGSAVVMNPVTNEVVAMVGGNNYQTSKVNVATSLRQPGSSFKPIVYVAGLEEGYTAATKFIDKSVNFGGNPPYIPRNYTGGYYGYVTMRKSLAWSLNIPAVEMLSLVGLDKVIRKGQEMGINIDDSAKRCGLALALGCNEVRLVDMIDAYSVFADGGKLGKHTGFTVIKDYEGNIVYQTKADKRQAIDEGDAYVMTNMLSDEKTRRSVFGYKNKLEIDRPAAAKTGTTDGYTDAWTIGYTPQYVVGAWVGNNDRAEMVRVSGLDGAAPMWNDIMTKIHEGIEVKEFERPESVVEIKISPNDSAPVGSGWGILEIFRKGTEPTDKENLDYLKVF